MTVFTACQALHKLDVKVAVAAYAGSLKKTLRGYANSGDPQLVIMQSGIGQLMASFLQGDGFDLQYGEVLCFVRAPSACGRSLISSKEAITIS
jgi:hypothetical protein